MYQHNQYQKGKPQQVAVVGAGVAGLSAALTLKKQGIGVVVFEKGETPGGHLQQWHALFPDREPAAGVLNQLKQEASEQKISLRTQTEVAAVTPSGNKFRIETSQGEQNEFDAVLLATGFQLFDAARKEEYGYGIYQRVITSAGLEQRLGHGGTGLTVNGRPPHRVAFVHCVGSRDEKVGNHYCSKVCCVTGVKQAITVKERYPQCEVLNFYMDLRMFGTGYEELYREAQEKWGVMFIRGRVSEASQMHDGTIQLKAEDTLMGRPVRATVDWLVLLVGMEPEKRAQQWARSLGLQTGQAGFFSSPEKFLHPSLTAVNGIFTAGACTGPASIPESVNQGRAAALSVLEFLAEKDEAGK